MNFRNLHLRIAGSIATVSSASDLPQGPGNTTGDIRYIEDTKELTMWDGSQWTAPYFGSLTVGELTVDNITHLNSNEVDIGDNFIVLNSDASGPATEDAGIIINRGSDTDAILQWNEATNTWEAGIEGGPLYPFAPPALPEPSVSPTFLFTRSAAVGANTWLLNGTVPSNQSGVHIAEATSAVKTIFVDSSTLSSYTLGVYEHDHVTYSKLGSVEVNSSYGANFNVDFSLTQGRKLAIMLEDGSATNVTVGLQIQVA